MSTDRTAQSSTVVATVRITYKAADKSAKFTTDELSHCAANYPTYGVSDLPTIESTVSSTK